MADQQILEELADLGRILVVDDGVIELETKLSESVLRTHLQKKFYAIQNVREGQEYNVVRLKETNATAITGPYSR